MRQKENIQHKLPEMLHKDIWVHYNVPAYRHLKYFFNKKSLCLIPKFQLLPHEMINLFNIFTPESVEIH